MIRSTHVERMNTMNNAQKDPLSSISPLTIIVFFMIIIAILAALMAAGEKRRSVLQTQVNDYANQVGSLNGQVGSLSGQVASLQAQVQSNNQAATNLASCQAELQQVKNAPTPQPLVCSIPATAQPAQMPTQMPTALAAALPTPTALPTPDACAAQSGDKKVVQIYIKNTTSTDKVIAFDGSAFKSEKFEFTAKPSEEARYCLSAGRYTVSSCSTDKKTCNTLGVFDVPPSLFFTF